MDDFEREMLIYSEFNRVDEEIKKPPALVRFKKMLEKNEECSIFDKIYEDQDIPEETQAKPSSSYGLAKIINQRERDQLTYAPVGRGRGRGGPQKIYYNPGLAEEYKLSDAEEIQRRIRQTSGLGFSNQLIMDKIKAVQFEKKSKSSSPHRPSNSHPTSGTGTPKSRTSTPVNGMRTSKELYPHENGVYPPEDGMITPRNSVNSPKCGMNSPRIQVDLSRSDENMLPNMKQSHSENGEFSDESSDYYTIQETSDEFTSGVKSQDISSTSESKAEEEEQENFEVQQEKMEEVNTVEKETVIIEPSKPISLTEMLRIARAEKKRKKENSVLNPMAKSFEPNSSSNSTTNLTTTADIPLITTTDIPLDIPQESSTETENSLYLTESEEAELSKKYIKQLLEEERLEEEKRKQMQKPKKPKGTAAQIRERQLQQHANWLSRHYTVDSRRDSARDSPSSSSGSEETLPWRRRGNSPPRHNWKPSFNLKPLNINSVEDFPTLK